MASNGGNAAKGGDGADYLEVGAQEDTTLQQARSKSYLDANQQPTELDGKTEAAAKLAEPAAAAAAAAPEERVKSPEEVAMERAQEVDITEHNLDLKECFEKFSVDPNRGLTTEDADKRRGFDQNNNPCGGSASGISECGMNQMTPPPKVPEWKKFAKEMLGPFNLLLWAAGILCFIAYALDSSIPDNVILGSVLFFVVSATGIFSYVQVAKSDAAMAQFAKLVPPSCSVRRDGEWNHGFDPAYLVLGDIVEVNQGNRVPADIRVVESSEFKVDNSSLTGESEPQKRGPKTSTEQNPLEAENLAFFTSNCNSGNALGLVIKIGDDTVIGNIQSLVGNTKAEQSPINKEIEHFIHLISSIALILGVTFFIIALSINPDDWIDAVVFFIGIVVANVPEGLLATVTVCLALCAKKMAEKNVLVKNLEAVETLGSTSCICSDKTGTLTQNRMTVVHTFYDGFITKIDDTIRAKDPGAGGVPEKSKLDVTDATLKEFWRCCQLCNTATFVPKDKSNASGPERCESLVVINRDTKGDASSSAILKFCDQVAVENEDAVELRKAGVYGQAEQPPQGPRDTAPVDAKTDANGQFIVDKATIEERKSWPDAQKNFRAKNPMHLEVPFDSKVKYSASVHDTSELDQNKDLLFCMKGAPERIIERCSYVLINGEKQPLEGEHLRAVEDGKVELMKKGERVLAFAYRRLPSDVWSDKGLEERDEDGNKTGVVTWGTADTTRKETSDFNGTNFGKVMKRVVKADDGSEKEIDVPFAYHGLVAKPDKGEKGELIFLGLLALIDPPRVAVPDAIRDCMTADIKVIMVTGDHPITAKAISKNIRIIRDKTPEDLAVEEGVIDETKEADTINAFYNLPQAQQKQFTERKVDEKNYAAPAMVVSGARLNEMTEEELDFVLQRKQLVFARTSPEQKLRVVKGCQRAGLIVAVTGDGVNDSPALKAADIGIAMGIAGNDVTKDAADMILLNDDFSSIVQGVKEGRIVFDNLKKSIAYTLTSNIPEISPFLLFIIVAVPLPLSTVMILAIDLGTDMAPAISMAYELAESDIMARPPRDPKKDNLVTLKLLQYTYLQIGMIQACAGFFCYFVVLSDSGYWPGKLPGLRDDYHDEDVFVTDSYNQEWVYDERIRALSAAQTSYFTSIVVVQWADLIICKTRVLSVFQQGMVNWTMNKAIVFETLLAIFISYCPGMDVALKTSPLQGTWWLPAMPFSLLIFLYDECRKYLMRKYRYEHPLDRKDQPYLGEKPPAGKCIDLTIDAKTDSTLSDADRAASEEKQELAKYAQDGWVETTTYY